MSDKRENGSLGLSIGAVFIAAVALVVAGIRTPQAGPVIPIGPAVKPLPIAAVDPDSGRLEADASCGAATIAVSALPSIATTQDIQRQRAEIEAYHRETKAVAGEVKGLVAALAALAKQMAELRIEQVAAEIRLTTVEERRACACTGEGNCKCADGCQTCEPLGPVDELEPTPAVAPGPEILPTPKPEPQSRVVKPRCRPTILRRRRS